MMKFIKKKKKIKLENDADSDYVGSKRFRTTQKL